jgi:hypothetical protein
MLLLELVLLAFILPKQGIEAAGGNAAQGAVLVQSADTDNKACRRFRAGQQAVLIRRIADVAVGRLTLGP